jgi:16S rRNA processing protein RimM
MARPEWIEVGRVSRPHGIRGEVRVTPDSDNPERFAEGSVLYARPARARLAGGGSQERSPLTVDTVRGEADYPIVAFREVEDREAAEGLRGFILEVSVTELPALPEDEFYPFDLEGLAVKDSQGAIVGRVTEVIASPAHPLLAISLNSGSEVLVPFVLAAVPTVELGEGCLVVEAGFLEIPGGDS